MVIVMIHENGAKESDSRDRHEDLPVFRQAPCGVEPGIVHFLQRVPGAFKAP